MTMAQKHVRSFQQAVSLAGDRRQRLAMSSSVSFTITNVELWPLDLPVTDPFVVATDHLLKAYNAFVRLTLDDGTIGYGEIAPFLAITGEDRASNLRKARVPGNHLLGQPALHYQRLGRRTVRTCPRRSRGLVRMGNRLTRCPDARNARTPRGPYGVERTFVLAKRTSPFPSPLWSRLKNSLDNGMRRAFVYSR